MKGILWLFLLPLIGKAQEAPKDINTIIVHGVTFEKVVNTLLDSGYRIDKIDKDFRTVRTEYKKFCKDCHPEVCFDVRVKDSIAYITGTWRNLMDKSQAGGLPVDNDGYLTPRRSFIMMDALAHSFPGKVTYVKM